MKLGLNQEIALALVAWEATAVLYLLLESGIS